LILKLKILIISISEVNCVNSGMKIEGVQWRREDLFGYLGHFLICKKCCCIVFQRKQIHAKSVFVGIGKKLGRGEEKILFSRFSESQECLLQQG